MSREAIRSILARRGLAPSRQRGQNFLRDPGLARTLVLDAGVGERDAVIEIGPGLGALTRALAERAARVVALEVDAGLVAYLREEAGLPPEVELHHADALAVDLRALRDRLAASVPGGSVRLVANLPYNVATPILSNLLHVSPWPHRMVATIQRELAERIAAAPRSKSYSALSVWIQSQCRAEIVRTLPPSVFWPRPKVESAIIDIRPQRVFRQRIADVAFFHELVRKIFLHRRKFLRSALLSAVKGILDKAAVDRVLADMGLTGRERAEELTPQQMIELADCVRRCAGRPAD